MAIKGSIYHRNLYQDFFKIQLKVNTTENKQIKIYFKLTVQLGNPVPKHLVRYSKYLK